MLAQDMLEKSVCNVKQQPVFFYLDTITVRTISQDFTHPHEEGLSHAISQRDTLTFVAIIKLQWNHCCVALHLAGLGSFQQEQRCANMKTSFSSFEG